MNPRRIALCGAAAVAAGLLAGGCTTPSYTTSSYHPGPVVGRTVGAGVGVVAGNTAGVVVGATEGLAGGIAAPFDTETHVVRRWHTEVTADGRTIQVPEDILVDSQGRPVLPVAPAAAPAATNTTATAR